MFIIRLLYFCGDKARRIEHLSAILTIIKQIFSGKQ
jgi:hypothetical protein